jgi:hypothetical protein
MPHPQEPSDSNPIDQKVSDRKIEANRENAKKSTGPRTIAGKLAMCRNATKHGLLSKALIFQDKQEEAEFQELVNDLVEELQPQSVVERVLTDEIAVSLWKIATAERWALQELYSRRTAATAILDVFINSSDGAGNPFSKQGKKVRNAARAGWDCRELVVRVGGNDEPGPLDESLLSSPEKKKSKFQFEAKLGDSAQTILRYQTTWKRDLYRAIESLRKLQRTRTAAESASPITG